MGGDSHAIGEDVMRRFAAAVTELLQLVDAVDEALGADLTAVLLDALEEQFVGSAVVEVHGIGPAAQAAYLIKGGIAHADVMILDHVARSIVEVLAADLPVGILDGAHGMGACSHILIAAYV